MPEKTAIPIALQPDRSGADDALLLREFGMVMQNDLGRRRVLNALPGIVAEQFDRAEALRILILRTMPYRQYLKTMHWRSVSARAKERASGRCQLCNTDQGLETHHRTYDRRGCEDDLDVTVLCGSCHGRFHKDPDSDEVDPLPVLTEEQELAWLREAITRKRLEQGLTAAGEMTSATQMPSGTLPRA